MEIFTKMLTKIYKTRSQKIIAVDHIDLNIEPGIHGFLGPNGAGKTSTVNMLMGVSSITEGEAFIRGKKAGSIVVRREIGFLPQDPVFYGNMTAHEYLLYAARLFGLSKANAKKKTKELLEYFELAEDKSKPISKLSGGMKQKVGLASILIHDPKLLILDEPTTNLDPLGRKKIIDYVRSLGKDKSIFVSSHILSEIEQMCDKVTIIDKGKIILTDTIENIKKMDSKARNLFILDTSSNSLILDELKKSEGVLKVWISEEDNKIHIIHKQKEKLQELISKLLTQNNVIIRNFYEPESSLQDIFIDLTTKGGK